MMQEVLEDPLGRVAEDSDRRGGRFELPPLIRYPSAPIRFKQAGDRLGPNGIVIGDENGSSLTHAAPSLVAAARPVRRSTARDRAMTSLTLYV
jgi:hypothetical protein